MADLHKLVTDQIIAALEAGAPPWVKSWDGSKRCGSGIPINAVTRKSYRGINVILLWAASMRFGSADMSFLTFKQAKDCGGSVRKGEHGTAIYFYKPLTIKDKLTEEEKQVPLLKTYTVFHVSQTEGCNFNPADPDETPDLPDDTVEFTSGLGMTLKHGGDTACYIPSADMVQMPFPQDFKSADLYRSALYHETVHWTGADKRLKRLTKDRFGGQDYAKEELVAEIGASFLCADFGLPYQTQHASYIQFWISKLNDDKRYIFQAASQAQKAVDYIRATILGTEPVAMAA